MVEDMGTGVLEDSHTKSGIPIEHLDYQYVEGCKNAKELEKILKVLRYVTTRGKMLEERTCVQGEHAGVTADQF